MKESSSLGVEDLEEIQKDLLSSSSSKTSSKLKGGGGGAATGSAHGTSSETNNGDSTAITIDGKTLGINDVLEMKKKIDDLILINEAKDKKIDEVG